MYISKYTRRTTLRPYPSPLAFCFSAALRSLLLGYPSNCAIWGISPGIDPRPSISLEHATDLVRHLIQPIIHLFYSPLPSILSFNGRFQQYPTLYSHTCFAFLWHYCFSIPICIRFFFIKWISCSVMPITIVHISHSNAQFHVSFSNLFISDSTAWIANC